MRKTFLKIISIVSALALLLSLAACTTGNQDPSKLKGRKTEKITQHLNWYTPARLGASQRKKLASSGVYVNEEGESLGESYQYWMKFYDFVMNGNAASLDVITVTDGKPQVVYLDCDGKTVLAAYKSHGKVHQQVYDSLEDNTVTRNGGTEVDSVLSNEGHHSWTLMSQTLPELPEYHYGGKNRYLTTVCEYLTSLGSESFHMNRGEAMVPVPMVLKVDDSNPNVVKIWGEFWILNYSRRGSILYNESGGEFPGVMVLTPTDAGYKVQQFRMTSDGDDMDDSLKSICAGDSALYHQFKQIVGDVSEPETAKMRKLCLQQYVKDNKLPVTAFEDYGWDPISLK